MKLKVDSKITWVSAAGFLTGTIENIVLDYNAAGEIIPWIYIREQEIGSVSRLCATDSYLKIMKVKLVDPELV